MATKKYGVNELREMFLSFFESKGHLRLPSFSLIPQNDASLLLINSGMAPMKPYFKGEVTPPRRRVCTCQKCIRTGDIDNIGHTARHGTYFEMLGNFSFGDYFKHEAIAWCWEFLTKVCGLEEDRLYPSIYENDDEAFEIWNKEIGIPADRIFRFGKEDNFWEHGYGPCGPCSEVYYDRGEKYGCGKPGCTVGCDCDRYMEIWNNVFSQFDNDGHGNYTDLVQKNIDTGMGLERLAVACQDVDSLFDVDTVMNITHKVTEITGAHYGMSHEKDVSLRVITDHIRASVFMISDGVLPSNEGRGYVLPATASCSAWTIRSCVMLLRRSSTRTRATIPTFASAPPISPASSAWRRRTSPARSTAACAFSPRCWRSIRKTTNPFSPAQMPSSSMTPTASRST